MIQIFGTAKCRGTKAAQRFFSERAVRVQFVDLKQKGLSAGELQAVARAVGIRALYDAAKDGTRRFAAPTDAALERDLVDHPEWLVTPIVRRGRDAAVGVDEAAWKALHEAEKAG